MLPFGAVASKDRIVFYSVRTERIVNSGVTNPGRNILSRKQQKRKWDHTFIYPLFQLFIQFQKLIFLPAFSFEAIDEYFLLYGRLLSGLQTATMINLGIVSYPRLGNNGVISR